MTGTYTKEIITRNQNHIKSYFEGNGGMTAFVRQVDVYMDAPNRMTPYHAIANMAMDGYFLIYTTDVVKYLHRLGLTDDKKLDKFKWSYNSYGVRHDIDGPMALYTALLARDGAKLYESWVKKHPRRN